MIPGADGAARRRLGEAQARVVATLVGGAEPPEGFDAARLRAQAWSLVAKRRGVVARLRPDAARAAGKDLAADFAAYARSRTVPPPGYRADADDFAAWLRAQGKMPAEPVERAEPYRRLKGKKPAASGDPARSGAAGESVRASWWVRLRRGSH
jgi:hypothetical protein